MTPELTNLIFVVAAIVFAILQQVPGTGELLYHYTERNNITKSAKYWALEMLEKGFETPGVIQLAGEDLDMDPLAYSALLGTIFRELGFEVQPEVANCAYAASIAEEDPRKPERMDGWMRRYFEAFLAANPKYRSTATAAQN